MKKIITPHLLLSTLHIF